MKICRRSKQDVAIAYFIDGNDAIATNQIELSPYLQSHKLVDFLKEQGIHVTSYMTLAVWQGFE